MTNLFRNLAFVAITLCSISADGQDIKTNKSHDATQSQASSNSASETKTLELLQRLSERSLTDPADEIGRQLRQLGTSALPEICAALPDTRPTGEDDHGACPAPLLALKVICTDETVTRLRTPEKNLDKSLRPVQTKYVDELIEQLPNAAVGKGAQLALSELSLISHEAVIDTLQRHFESSQAESQKKLLAETLATVAGAHMLHAFRQIGEFSFSDAGLYDPLPEDLVQSDLEAMVRIGKWCEPAIATGNILLSKSPRITSNGEMSDVRKKYFLTKVTTILNGEAKLLPATANEPLFAEGAAELATVDSHIDSYLHAIAKRISHERELELNGYRKAYLLMILRRFQLAETSFNELFQKYRKPEYRLMAVCCAGLQGAATRADFTNAISLDQVNSYYFFLQLDPEIDLAVLQLGDSEFRERGISVIKQRGFSGARQLIRHMRNPLFQQNDVAADIAYLLSQQNPREYRSLVIDELEQNEIHAILLASIVKDLGANGYSEDQIADHIATRADYLKSQRASLTDLLAADSAALSPEGRTEKKAAVAAWTRATAKVDQNVPLVRHLLEKAQACEERIRYTEELMNVDVTREYRTNEWGLVGVMLKESAAAAGEDAARQAMVADIKKYIELYNAAMTLYVATRSNLALKYLSDDEKRLATKYRLANPVMPAAAGSAERK